MRMGHQPVELDYYRVLAPSIIVGQLTQIAPRKYNNIFLKQIYIVEYFATIYNLVWCGCICSLNICVYCL
jgi:hypothetical protein